MKKIIKFTDNYNKVMLINCYGKDKDILASSVYLLQSFVINYFHELFEGAKELEHKASKNENLDLWYWTEEEGDIDRRFISINGTEIDEVFGITALSEDSPKATFKDGRIINKRWLRVRDIEIAVKNIQLLVNHSKLKPLKKKSNEKNNQT